MTDTLVPAPNAPFHARAQHEKAVTNFGSLLDVQCYWSLREKASLDY